VNSILEPGREKEFLTSIKDRISSDPALKNDAAKLLDSLSNGGSRAGRPGISGGSGGSVGRGGRGGKD